MLAVEDQEVRTADIAGEVVAYSIVGAGPPLLVGGWWCSHLTLNWEDPLFRAYISRLATHHTVVRYDLPGTGASGAGEVPDSLDAEVSVLSGVVRHLGLERFALLGASSGAATAAALAAAGTHRVTRLVLYGGFARGVDLAAEPARSALIDAISTHWGVGSRLLADVFVPGASSKERADFARFQRRSATPEQAARSLAASYRLDATEHLGRVTVRTTVIHRREDRAVPCACGVDVARRIRGATFVGLDGVDHFPWRGDSAAVVDATLRGLGHAVREQPDVPGPASVTPRELEVLELVAGGLTDAQIAERLTVSTHTVHRHIANARLKLGVRSRAAAAVAMAEWRERQGLAQR